MLGSLQVWVDNDEVALGSPSQRRLLAMLLVNSGSVVSSDRLIDVLWAGEPPTSALASLHTLVSRLRSSIGATSIITRGSGYVVEPAFGALDATRFTDLLRAVRDAHPFQTVARLDEALSLWRGDALAEFGDEEWARPFAVLLEEQRRVAHDERIDALLACGRIDDAVAAAEGRCQVEPLRERTHALLMRALAGQGRAADALRAFDRFRKRLAAETGLDPSPMLAAVEREVLDGSSTGDARAPVRAVPLLAPLPAEPNRLVGREVELDALRVLLEAHRVVTLVGVGGVGKTRLALRLAAEVGPSFLDGIAFVELAEIRDPGQVANVIRHTLRTASPTSDPLATVVSELQARNMLVILDNCEHVIDAAADAAAAIAAGCPSVRIIATSREPLGIAAEQQLPVRPLGDEADQLFVDRATMVRPGLALDDLERRSVTELCRRLDGLPLAIELAAAQVAHLAPSALLAHLDDRFTVLSSTRRDLPDRHCGLAAVIDWSWDLLAPDERAGLTRLSIFPGGCTLDAAESVCAGDGLPTAEVLGLLGSLVRKSLVSLEDGEVGARYRLLDTIRTYAARRLAEGGSGRTLQVRFVEWGTDVFELVGRLTGSPQEPAGAQLWEVEYANLSAAFATALTFDDIEPAMRWARSLASNMLGNLSQMRHAHLVRAIRQRADFAIHPDWLTRSTMSLQWSYGVDHRELVRMAAVIDAEGVPLRQRAWAIHNAVRSAYTFGTPEERALAPIARLQALADDTRLPANERAISFTVLSFVSGDREYQRRADAMARSWAERARIPSTTAMVLLQCAAYVFSDDTAQAIRTLEEALTLTIRARNPMARTSIAYWLERVAPGRRSVRALLDMVRLAAGQGTLLVINRLSDVAETLARAGYAEDAAVLVGALDAGVSHRATTTKRAEAAALAHPRCSRRGAAMSAADAAAFALDALERAAGSDGSRA